MSSDLDTEFEMPLEHSVNPLWSLLAAFHPSNGRKIDSTSLWQELQRICCHF